MYVPPTLLLAIVVLELCKGVFSTGAKFRGIAC